MLIAWYLLPHYLRPDIFPIHPTLFLFLLDLALLTLLQIILAAIDIRPVLFVMVVVVEDCDLDVSLEMQFLYLYLLVTLLLHW